MCDFEAGAEKVLLRALAKVVIWANQDKLAAMQVTGRNGGCSLREVLAESHVAGIAIAVLLLWSLDFGFRALWGPLSSIGIYLLTAMAIFDIPYFTFTVIDRFMLITSMVYAFSSLISLAAAWCLCLWVYGVGPLRSLGTYRARLAKEKQCSIA